MFIYRHCIISDTYYLYLLLSFSHTLCHPSHSLCIYKYKYICVCVCVYLCVSVSVFGQEYKQLFKNTLDKSFALLPFSSLSLSVSLSVSPFLSYRVSLSFFLSGYLFTLSLSHTLYCFLSSSYAIVLSLSVFISVSLYLCQSLSLSY